MIHRSIVGLFVVASLGLLLSENLAPPARAQEQTQGASDDRWQQPFTTEEIKQAGHKFFGGVTREFALAIEQLFSRYGRPNGYILGEEAGGALIGGLRYGEGTLHTRNAGTYRVFWQGPSLGWDFGADGAKTMILVYNLTAVDDIYAYFAGVAGAAYLVGGVGVTVMSHNQLVIAPIRSGIGARLGVNVGYLKFTQRPTWNPF